ncbi:hypothetical protein ARMGADRAFT_1082240 [Armillaria gallica]|uniref:Uncharacterized protein n=1 Tax=Armillaria gallica TaxID=47427 RepID=A0A2H3D6Y6_ARMGA|nr:hypothetical protein ARMGADRAFT_1082240 [Armillaria gallica]
MKVANNVPMLRVLSLVFPDVEDGDRCTAFSHAPQLRTVAIKGGWIPEIQLPWMQIKTLEFNRDDFVRPFDWTIIRTFVEIIHSLYSPSILPNLTSLEFIWAPEHSDWSDALIAMLHSRVTASTDAKLLKSVTLGIRNGEEMPSDVVMYMKELRAFGVIASLW